MVTNDVLKTFSNVFESDGTLQGTQQTNTITFDTDWDHSSIGIIRDPVLECLVSTSGGECMLWL